MVNTSDKDRTENIHIQLAKGYTDKLAKLINEKEFRARPQAIEWLIDNYFSSKEDIDKKVLELNQKFISNNEENERIKGELAILQKKKADRIALEEQDKIKQKARITQIRAFLKAMYHGSYIDDEWKKWTKKEATEYILEQHKINGIPFIELNDLVNEIYV